LTPTVIILKKFCKAVQLAHPRRKPGFIPHVISASVKDYSMPAIQQASAVWLGIQGRWR
jgi:hypothetical protein